MKILWISFSLFLFLFLVPCARGDPATGDELLEQIKQQNELMVDLLVLYQSGYNPAKTDMVAFLENQKVEKYLKENSIISKNTGVMITRMEALTESVNVVAKKLEVLDERLLKEERLGSRHAVLIDRNTTDISRIFYIIAIVSGFLASAAWAGHSWAHRNDQPTTGER